jgi:hypothetical protein
MVRLSKNFTLQEFTKSQIAERKGIDNIPGEIHLERAKKLFENIVQKVRDNFGVTIINSGYRSGDLNYAIGGSNTSQHCKGEAVDIECPGTPNYDVAKWIEDNLDFDQLILEFYTPGIPDSGWVHVSYKTEDNRRSILTAMKENGKTIYKPNLIQ